MTKAAVYLRQSLDRDGSGDAIARQRKACLALCEARGWQVVRVYDKDNSVSASKDRAAGTDFARMLDDAKAGAFDVVVAYAVDRLARRLSDIERLIGTGVKAATVQGGLDLTTPEGEAQAGILATFARMEVRQKAKRQKDAHAQRVERGLPPIGKRAIGWQRDGMTLVEPEAEAVRDGAGLILAGASLRSVARAWNDAGLTTAHGTPWKPYAVRSVLLNPRTAGLSARQVGRDRWDVLGQGTWPALLPEERWRAVCDVLTDPGRRTTPDTARRYLLAGLARCGVEGCGRPLLTGGTARGVRTLKCLPVLHLSRAAEPVEDYVESVILERLSRPDAADLSRPETREDAKRLRAELAAVRKRRASLARLLADGTLTEAEVRRSAADLDAQAAELQTRLADAGQLDVLAPLITAEDIRATWDGMTIEVRRAVIGTLATVTVYPPGRGARAFDPSTVRVEPRRS